MVWNILYIPINHLYNNVFTAEKYELKLPSISNLE